MHRYVLQKPRTYLCAFVFLHLLFIFGMWYTSCDDFSLAMLANMVCCYQLMMGEVLVAVGRTICWYRYD